MGANTALMCLWQKSMTFGILLEQARGFLRCMSDDTQRILKQYFLMNNLLCVMRNILCTRRIEW